MATIEKICEGCKHPFQAEYPSKRFCSRQCWLRRYNVEDKEHGMRGAKKAGATNIKKLRGTGSGYIKEYGVHQHRRVVERILGRQLLPGEVVHHINGHVQDNDPNNLAVMSQADHVRLHHKEMTEARVAKNVERRSL